ncbi:MAG: hypothetical protein JW776_11770 [Candidatus Lokiarchaeota archaeon]|nr:hypothetical protein [Candidatus Lokiarchaeota archaeon]
MKKYGIGTGIFTLIFGFITYIAFRIYFLIRSGASEVDDIGLLIIFVSLGLAMMIISFIIGLIGGGLTFLFGIITIVRIVKSTQESKMESKKSTEPEPKLS